MATFAVSRAEDDVRRSLGYYRVWFYLALDDILARYRNTVLGPIWNASYIIAQALALSLVFGAVLKQPLHVILPYILTGLVGWALGPGNILECAGLLVWFGGTIKTQNFPFLFYAFRLVARSILMFAHNFVALLIVLPLVTHGFPIINLTIVPALFMIAFLSVPYCLLIGMLCARYRDIQMLVANFSNVLFFATPIFWMPSSSPGIRSSAILVYNPFYYMVDIIRQPLLGAMPGPQDWMACGGMAVFGWLLCLTCLSAFRSRIAFWV